MANISAKVVLSYSFLLPFLMLPASVSNMATYRRANRMSTMPLYFQKRSLDFIPSAPASSENSPRRLKWASRAEHFNSDLVNLRSGRESQDLIDQERNIQISAPRENSPSFYKHYDFHETFNYDFPQPVRNNKDVGAFPNVDKRYSPMSRMPGFFGKRNTLSRMPGFFGKRNALSRMPGFFGKRNTLSRMPGFFGKRNTLSRMPGFFGKRNALSRMPGFFGKRNTLSRMPGFFGKRNTLSRMPGFFGKRNTLSRMPGFFGKRSPFPNVSESSEISRPQIKAKRKPSYTLHRMPAFYGKRFNRSIISVNTKAVNIKNPKRSTLRRMPAFYGKRTQTFPHAESEERATEQKNSEEQSKISKDDHIPHFYVRRSHPPENINDRGRAIKLTDFLTNDKKDMTYDRDRIPQKEANYKKLDEASFTDPANVNQLLSKRAHYSAVQRMPQFFGKRNDDLLMNSVGSHDTSDTPTRVVRSLDLPVIRNGDPRTQADPEGTAGLLQFQDEGKTSGTRSRGSKRLSLNSLLKLTAVPTVTLTWSSSRSEVDDDDDDADDDDDDDKLTGQPVEVLADGTSQFPGGGVFLYARPEQVVIASQTDENPRDDDDDNDDGDVGNDEGPAAYPRHVERDVLEDLTFTEVS